MNFYKILIVLSVIIVTVLLLWKMELFTIKKVEIEKNNADCLDDKNLLSKYNILKENIIFINEGDLNKTILEKNICVKNIFLEKKIPNTLKIIINGRKGFARIVKYNDHNQINLDNLESSSSSQAALLDWSFSSSESVNYIVDEEGLIFTQKEEDNLPMIYLSEQILEVGKKIENIDFSKIVQLFVKLPQMNRSFTQVKISEHRLQIKNDQKIVFSLEKDILMQLASLHLILEKAKIDNRSMDSIDLRFDKPVVKYLPKK